MRIAVALAEARRGGGVAELVALARSTDLTARVLALRGLGRTGGDDARAVLLEALRDRDPRVVRVAAEGIGIAAALDEPAPEASIDAALRALLDHPSPEVVVAAIGAIGRAGSAALQAPVAALATRSEPIVAEAVALAFGRYGRRKLALSPAARSALVALADGDVARYAAVWALSREHLADVPDADKAVGAAALAKHVGDADPEVAAQAIAGLGRRKAAVPDAPGSDWRIAVERVRALSDRAAILAASAPHATHADARVHALLEGLRALKPVPRSAVALPVPATMDPLTRGWVECLAAAARASRASIEACALPDHLKLPLLAPLPGAWRTLVAHADPRVRAAGLGAAATAWKTARPEEQRGIMRTLVEHVAAKDAMVVGAALEAATAIDAKPAARAPLEAALVARAATETDVELATALYGLIGTWKLTAGLASCRRGLEAPAASAKAARACVVALGETAASPSRLPTLPLPPVDVTAVIGHELRWRVETNRGELVIRLRPDIAPWAVATVVALTRKGYYDGLELHRVVPNFVAQGGDPTQSGWGGPGFTIPSEPSAEPGFTTGGVGIADAGRDSGGSQWFVMHARAPHLDGRYTWFGTLEAGQPVADRLLVGDKVVRARIEEAAH